MKVDDVRPPKQPKPAKDRLRFTLTFKREYDSDFLQDENGNSPTTTEAAVAHLQKAAKDDYNSIEDMLMEWEILIGDTFDNGFDLDVELIIPGQKQLI